MPVEQRGQVIAVDLGQLGHTGRSPNVSGRRQPSCGDTRRMNREVQVRICERLGVKFLGPTRPSALRQIEKNGKIDLVFTDIGLPGMNGGQFIDEARKRRPTIRVLYTTAYAQNAVV